ncbi:unnamed protein product [Arctia plantaginis]|uniref:Uncharacterized protein n=1 Tax=Arctia plantaginis TaxID=874455 RepID=A0A8S0ZZH7_ARCPL|nr:unnamed protein product [Arctia plantaginis]CAB3237872.1 unnamed protein product [Arctia plantaginis]
MLTISFTVVLFLAVSCPLRRAQPHGFHDIEKRSYGYEHDLLYKVDIYKCGIPLVIRTTVLEYPEPRLFRYSLIMAVNIRNHLLNGTQDCATIVSGGVGNKFVRIKLRSQMGEGLNFTIKIYGLHM